MNLAAYLTHRRRYEFLAVSAGMLLIALVNATTLGLEDLRVGLEPNWLVALATELSSVLVAGVLLVPLIWSLKKLDLRFGKLKWRVLWLLPTFIAFSLLHIAGFVVLRKLLWSLAGSSYSFDPWMMGLLYEIRKDFLTFILMVGAYYCYVFILGRLQGEASFLSSQQVMPREEYRQQFLVKMLDREYLVRVEDIDWVQSASNYVLLHCGDRQYPMRQTLKSLSVQLEPGHFQRTHRTAIVNVRRVESIVQGESALQLKSGEKIPVSKTYLPELKAVLTDTAPAVATNT